MSVLVVDEFEVVQVQIADAQIFTASPTTLRHRLLHSVGKQHAVGQVGQFVVIRHVFESVLRFLEFGDVGDHHAEIGNVAVSIADRPHPRALNVVCAVAPDAERFAFPAAGFEQALPLLLNFGFVQSGCAGLPERLAQCFGRRIAGDQSEGRVGFDHGAAAIGHQDALGRSLEDRVGQPQAFLGELAFADILDGSGEPHWRVPGAVVEASEAMHPERFPVIGPYQTVFPVERLAALDYLVMKIERKRAAIFFMNERSQTVECSRVASVDSDDGVEFFRTGPGTAVEVQREGSQPPSFLRGNQRTIALLQLSERGFKMTVAYPEQMRIPLLAKPESIEQHRTAVADEQRKAEKAQQLYGDAAPFGERFSLGQ